VRTILSGPAGGVVGATHVASAAGFEEIITFDMGGTSTDVALCAGGSLRLTNEATVAGLPVAVPVLDIHTVGAGGGSIARVDAGGSLRVGPQSAGAVPGPACYGRGTQPTVTDANLVLGRFGGADLLGGEFELDERRAVEALMNLAREMSEASGREVLHTQAALGVVRVVNAGVERALRAVSVERGFDPRACVNDARQRHARTIAARYRGQSFELEIPWGRRAVARFHREHAARYGYAQSADTIEVVSARLFSAGLVERLKDERPRRAAAL